MKTKIISFFLAVILMFTAACAASPDDEIVTSALTNTSGETLQLTETIPTSTAASTEPVISETTIPTTIPETTAPDKSLYIEPGRHQFRYYDNNTNDYLDYHLFVPNNPQKNMPLIIFLHGMGEVDKIDELKDYGIASVIYQLYGDDFPFFLLMPCTHERSWSKEQIPVTLKSLIDETVSSLAIDTDHIILTGHSLGAIGTWRMVSNYGNFFSAAVPISCGIDEELDFSNFSDIPIWGFCGTDGYYEVNYHKAMVKLVDQINANGGNAVLTVYEGFEHHETIAYPYTVELFNWMLAQ